jgi:carbamoyltransferase
MSPDVYVLGVSMSNHDRAACLLKNGQIVGAIAEERLDRRKRSEGFYGYNRRGIVLPPLAAITYVLRQGGVELDQLDLVVCGRSMRLCRDDLLAYLPLSPARVAEPPMPGHHLSHAYSAYGPAPFERMAVLVIDEQGHHLPDGSFEKCSWFQGKSGPLERLDRFEGGPDDLSVGMFYNAFGALTGLREAGKPAAGKLMGLAPFGRPRPEWPALIDCDPNTGDTHISLRRLDSFFTQAGLRVWPGMEEFAVARLDDLVIKYAPARWQDDLAADLARKAQDELEAAVLRISAALHKRTGESALAYAGGVALNCTTNRRLRECGWEDVFVQPAATDDGNAIGLTFYGWIELLGRPRTITRFFNPFTGRRYRKTDVDEALAGYGLTAHAHTVDAAAEGAERLSRGEIIGWFQGASEWGPRALGGRSFAANPLIHGIRDRLNSTVKYREAFRPFAISAPAADLAALVELDGPPPALAPYMLAAGAGIDPRLAEVRHVDGSVRYQAVNPGLQPEWHALIMAFGERTGLPAVLNTSFNTLGEPLVETPDDALRQFLVAGADALIMEDSLVAREQIPPAVLEAAVKRAWGSLRLDPFQTALGLEAAGYLEAGLRVLEQVGFTAEQAFSKGPAVWRSYNAFMQRAAVRRNDPAAAAEHADLVLRWSGLSFEAFGAAGYLAESGAGRQRNAGRLMRLIAPLGAAYDFAASMPGFLISALGFFSRAKRPRAVLK